MTSGSDHISFEALADLAEGREPATRDARAHLATCPACHKKLARLETVVAAMRSDPSEDPLPFAVAAARRAFAARAVEQPPPLLRRIIAALTFASSSLTPAHGFRSSEPAERSLFYEAGGVDVQLNARLIDGEWVISGQVLGPCEGGAVVVTGPAGETSAPLTEMCEFALPPMSAGAYTIVVRLAEAEIVLPDLALE